MNFFAMKRGCTIGAVALVAAVVAACGGGGGSAGENPNAPYDLRLTANAGGDGVPKTELPLNLNNVPPSIGGPYTTTLVIDAVASNRPIPTEDFACSLNGGVDVGGLYKLDGTDEEDEDGSPKPSRSIVLGSNSGMATFHFHAGSLAGDAIIRCTMVNNQNRTAEISIKVGDYGGTPSGAYIATTTTGNRGFVITQNVVGGTVGPLKQLTMQAAVFDDFGQPVAKPAGNNLRVSILPNSPSNALAAQDAELRAGGNTSGNKVLSVPTVNGLATFTIVSGNATGAIALELVADRSDNNVDNGIQDPVSNIAVVYAVTEIPSSEAPTPLVSESASFTAPIGREFFQALTASGGVPGYTWSIVSGALPSGLTLSSNGVISGTPTALGSRTVQLLVQDSAASALPPSATQSVRTSVTINVQAINSGLGIVCSGTTISANACDITNATVGLGYSHAFSAQGGTGTYAWALSDLPDFLTFDAANLNVLQVRSNRSLTCNDLNVTTTTEEIKDDQGVVIGTETKRTYSPRTYGFLVSLTSGDETAVTLARMTVSQGNAVCN